MYECLYVCFYWVYVCVLVFLCRFFWGSCVCLCECIYVCFLGVYVYECICVGYFWGVCVCISLCVCFRGCMCVWVNSCIYFGMCVSLVCLFVGVYVCMTKYVYVMGAYVCMYVCMYVYMYVCMYVKLYKVLLCHVYFSMDK